MNHLLKLSLLSASLSACVHVPFEDTTQKASTKTAPREKSKMPEEPAGSQPAPLYSEDVGLYLKVSDLRTSLSAPEVQDLRKIAASLDRSPLHRAVLIFGVLRSYLHEGVDPITFDQAVLLERTPLQVSNWTHTESLEKLFTEIHISLKTEIDENPFAQNLSILELALRGTEQDPDKNSAFQNELRAKVNEKIAEWSKVRDKLGVVPITTTPVVDPTLTNAPADNGVVLPPPPPVEPEPTSVPLANIPVQAPASEAEIFKQSSELAEKNRYEDALRLLRRLDASKNPEALSKIKELANKAVSDLRTKAARSYQSAIPVQDMKARGNYLREAQQYLQTALDKYPESDQLDAVRLNLNTIEKNLKVINKN